MNDFNTGGKKLFVAGILCWAIVSIIYSVLLTGILKTYGLTWVEIITDAFINNLLLAGSCLLIFNNMRYYLPGKEKYWYVFTISFALSGISSLLARTVLWLIFKNDLHYIAALGQSTGIRFGILFLLVGCVALISLLWYTQAEQKDTSERKADLERLSREAELFTLRQQLQPHFLFNSLNSISALTVSQPEKARHMIQQLSDFLRGTLRNDDKLWNSLEEELQYLRLYLDIEKVRFGHRLQTEITCTDPALAGTLPLMLLQPVVENAIKFGLYDTTGNVLITVQAEIENSNLKIMVQNPFDPETSQPVKGTGFGLSYIQRRLFLLFARQDLLITEKDGTCFTTTILIPQV